MGAPGDLEAVQYRHADVDDRDVRAQVEQLVETLAAGCYGRDCKRMWSAAPAASRHSVARK
jgi:hypothetical protein